MMKNDLMKDKRELKQELLSMLLNYWQWDNNEECIKATFIFLKRIGLSDKDITFLDAMPNIIKITKSDMKDYLEKLEECNNTQR